MSKSKGNVMTPMPLVEEFGSDAVRYWACNGRPGTDTTLDTGIMKIGRRLAIKILNASKFALGRLGDGPAPSVGVVSEPIDRALLAKLAAVVTAATTAFEEFDYARALEGTETFFWSFCDDYVELVKTRAYGGEDDPRGRLRPGHAGTGPLRPVPAAGALPALRHRRGVALVAGGLHPPRPWPTVAEFGEHRSRGSFGARGGRRRAGGGAAGQDHREALHAVRGGRAHRRRARPPPWPPSTAARRDIVDAGGVEALELVEAAEFSVVSRLAPPD